MMSQRLVLPFLWPWRQHPGLTTAEPHPHALDAQLRSVLCIPSAVRRGRELLADATTGLAAMALHLTSDQSWFGADLHSRHPNAELNGFYPRIALVRAHFALFLQFGSMVEQQAGTFHVSVASGPNERRVAFLQSRMPSTPLAVVIRQQGQPELAQFPSASSHSSDCSPRQEGCSPLAAPKWLKLPCRNLSWHQALSHCSSPRHQRRRLAASAAPPRGNFEQPKSAPSTQPASTRIP